jgi:hypothetical protein
MMSAAIILSLVIRSFGRPNTCTQTEGKALPGLTSTKASLILASDWLRGRKILPL